MRRDDRRTLGLLEELAAEPVGLLPARRARLSSMLRTMIGPGRIVWVTPEPVGRLLAQEVLDLMDVHVRPRSTGDGHVEVALSKSDLATVVRRAELLDRRGRLLVGLPGSVVSASADSGVAALSGLVLAGGCFPRSGRSPQLQLDIPTLEAALVYVRLARRVGVNLKVRDSPDVIASARGADLSRLLGVLGAPRTREALESALANERRASPPQGLDTLSDANLDRSLQAARRVCVDVEAALEVLGAAAPEHLAYAGRLRLAHPDLPLEALGRQAEPPMSKDAIAGRLRRLIAMARDRAPA